MTLQEKQKEKITKRQKLPSLEIDRQKTERQGHRTYIDIYIDVERERERTFHLIQAFTRVVTEDEENAAQAGIEIELDKNRQIDRQVRYTGERYTKDRQVTDREID